MQEHLAELVVKNEDDVAKLLEQGTKVRKVAATQMNDRSSRSHSCFIIKIEQKTTGAAVASFSFGCRRWMRRPDNPHFRPRSAQKTSATYNAKPF